jgi:hypothetical protein
MFSKQILYIFFLVLSFTPPVLVLAVSSYEVTTYSATNICQGGGTLNGYVNPFFSNDTTRWFEWGTSQDYLSNQTNTTRSGNNTEYFQQDIYNLAPNTVYYFRVAAKNSKGLARGDVLSFTTRGSACPTGTSVSAPVGNTTSGGYVYTNTNTSNNANPGINTYVSQSVITKPATNIINTSAILSAVALPLGSTQTYGWFEWGNTPNLGYNSVRRYLGVGNTLSWNEVLSGLTPGTTYFFKPVIENQNGRVEGTLFSFHTTGMTPVITSVSNTSNTPTVSVGKKPIPSRPTSQMAAAATLEPQNTLQIEVIPNTDTANIKERVGETIKFENTTGATLKNLTVRVIVPCSMVYVPTGGDDFTQNGTMLTHKIGDVKPKEKISLLLWMEVGTDVADKTPIETIAVVDWEDKTHPNKTESVGRATVTVDKNKIPKTSAAAAGADKNIDSVFPKNLKDWGGIIGFLFLLFAAYMVFLIARGKKEEEVLAETISFEEISARPVLHRVGVPQRNYIKDPFVSDGNIQKSKTIIPIVPVKKAINEKGAPPENLPI